MYKKMDYKISEYLTNIFLADGKFSCLIPHSYIITGHYHWYVTKVYLNSIKIVQFAPQVIIDTSYVKWRDNEHFCR
jgi:hypothetical protein